MSSNIFQKRVKVVAPKALSNEQIYVYVPIANSTGARGIAAFYDYDFVVDNNAVVSINLEHYYNKAQIDAIIADLIEEIGETYYTKEEADARFQLKSDMANYYTKTEIDGILDDYYTKTAIDTMLAAIEAELAPLYGGLAGQFLMSRGSGNTPAWTGISVSATGTATDEVNYITIAGVQKKLAGGSDVIWRKW